MADEYSIDELLELAREERAADTGVCDHFEAVEIAGLPPGMPAHGPRCGCNQLTGYVEQELCRICGRHPEVH